MLNGSGDVSCVWENGGDLCRDGGGDSCNDVNSYQSCSDGVAIMVVLVVDMMVCDFGDGGDDGQVAAADLSFSTSVLITIVTHSRTSAYNVSMALNSGQKSPRFCYRYEKTATKSTMTRDQASICIAWKYETEYCGMQHSQVFSFCNPWPSEHRTEGTMKPLGVA